MLVCKNRDTLVFIPNYFHCFESNVGNMAFTHKLPHRQTTNKSFCFLYNVVTDKIHPFGVGVEGVYSQPKVYIGTSFDYVEQVCSFKLIRGKL